MHVILLGSAAGGGIPQWNCACPNCQLARRGEGVKPRTQDSIAVSADGQRWFLLNVSPDIGRQIERTPALWPRPPHESGARLRARGSPIAGAVLTNGDVDHCLGLLSLREWTPLSVYATRETYGGLVRENAIFRTLERQRPHVLHRPLELVSSSPSAAVSAERAFVALGDTSGEASGLSVAAFPVAGKVPLHLEGRVEPSAEANVGLLVRDDRSGARIAYVPAAASVDGIAEQTRGASCLFFDGTFWSDRELMAFGQSTRLAREMAHLPVGDAAGSLELLEGLDVPRRFYTHVNNTNPMLREGSDERRRVEARGWTIAEDGLELSV